MKKCILFSILLTIFNFGFSANAQSSKSMQSLKKQIIEELAKQKGTFAVAFKNLSNGKELLINEHENFHAASTMKTPVMIEVFKQAAMGKFSLNDSLIIKNEFKSIVDSSNLSTNIIIQLVGAKNVTQTMRKLGAKDILVLRGVEDNKAYEKGLNNTTTAYDLMLIFEKMAKGKTVNRKASEAMIKILLDQTFNTIIPAGLPKDVKVAHKTGSITGVHHDSGIIFLPDGRKYILVLLSKNLEEETAAVKAMACVSEMIYHYLNQ